MIFDVCILLILLVLTLALLYVYLRRKNLPIKKAGTRCLLVVAHPDDETMFFGPTISSLLSKHSKIYVLCLSTGDFYGLGDTRKTEMFNACGRLGITSSNVTIMDIGDMKDGQKWETEKLARIILQYIEKLSADIVITFDQHGVSHHINHISCFKSLQFLYTNGWIPVDTNVFVLDTIPIYRKYIAFCDFFYSHLFSNFMCLSSPRQIWCAMRAHKSQLVWFRYLYLIFSRYVTINTLKRITDRKSVV